MATYRLEAKVISRANGRSATASAAYRSGAAIEDERTGEIFDYTRKRGVLHAEIIAPANTPEWMLDRSALWNAVERVEMRRDAQLARDFILSLPHELTDEQRVELVRDFLASEFVARGMVADFAIHAPDRRSDQRNHHAHVMVTMRELTGTGFGLKNRNWNKTALLEEWRERWADSVNFHLERHGHETRVDHRSLEDQGANREPEPKQGPVATQMERNGKTSHAGDDRRAVKSRNEEREALSRAANDVEAELVMLDPDRPRGPAFEDVREALEGDKEKRRARPGYADTDGGMVAQQAEAIRRFKRNSEALEARRRAEPEQPVPSHLDGTDEPSTLSPETSESPPMQSRFDRLRSEQSKATDGKEQPSKPVERGEEPSKPASRFSPTQGTGWSMDQSMPAQNAAANRWAQESQARRQDQDRAPEGRPGANDPSQSKAERPPSRFDMPTEGGGSRGKGKDKEEQEPTYRREVSPQLRADMKREQAEREQSRGEKDGKEQSQRPDRDKGPDLGR